MKQWCAFLISSFFLPDTCCGVPFVDPHASQRRRYLCFHCHHFRGFLHTQAHATRAHKRTYTHAFYTLKRTKPEILKTCYRHTLLLRLLALSSTPPLPRISPDTEEGEEKHLHPRHPANAGGEGVRKEALEFLRTLEMIRQYLYFCTDK